VFGSNAHEKHPFGKTATADPLQYVLVFLNQFSMISESVQAILVVLFACCERKPCRRSQAKSGLRPRAGYGVANKLYGRPTAKGEDTNLA